MPVSAAELFAWHARPGAFERLNPPWQPVEILERGGGIENGARTVIRVPMGPFKKTWVAIHEGFQQDRQFQDRQERGPFASFLHTHRTIADGLDASILEDEIDYALPMGWLGRLAGGRLARRQLVHAFAYRHAVTRNELTIHALRRGLPPWKILVTGAGGLVGSALVPFLTTGGHEVTRIARARGNANTLTWRELQSGQRLEALEGLDAVLHLAGENIGGGRWSTARKERLRASRLDTTAHLMAALGKLGQPPKTLVSASAVGYYGDRGGEELPETASAGTGFLADLCQAWEAVSQPAQAWGTRVVHLRFGVILDPRGGALKKMLTPFRLGLGGKIGNGQQWISWVALDDVLGVMHHVMAHDRLTGPINVAAPQTLTNHDFTKGLGRVLFRPTIFPLPAFAAKLAFGEMARETLLASTRAVPQKLLASGYRFSFPDLGAALRHLLGKNVIPAE